MPHTYGPLRYRDLDTKQKVTHTCGCVNYISGDIGYCPLHAAAPDLLEACQLMQQAIQEYRLLDVKKRFSLSLAHAAIGKAIAKAGG